MIYKYFRYYQHTLVIVYDGKKNPLEKGQSLITIKFQYLNYKSSTETVDIIITNKFVQHIYLITYAISRFGLPTTTQYDYSLFYAKSNWARNKEIESLTSNDITKKSNKMILRLNLKSTEKLINFHMLQDTKFQIYTAIFNESIKKLFLAKNWTHTSDKPNYLSYLPGNQLISKLITLKFKVNDTILHVKQQLIKVLNLVGISTSNIRLSLYRKYSIQGVRNRKNGYWDILRDADTIQIIDTVIHDSLCHLKSYICIIDIIDPIMLNVVNNNQILIHVVQKVEKHTTYYELGQLIVSKDLSIVRLKTSISEAFNLQITSGQFELLQRNYDTNKWYYMNNTNNIHNYSIIGVTYEVDLKEEDLLTENDWSLTSNV